MASSSYVCDTLPPPKLASASDVDQTQSPRGDSPPVTTFDLPSIDAPDHTDEAHAHEQQGGEGKGKQGKQAEVVSEQPPPRKLCVRHQRMAHEGTNLKLQQALDKLPLEDREAINGVWASFSASPHPRRALILQGLLTMCCFSQLSLLTEQLQDLIRLDPFRVFPREVSLQVLSYLDAYSLCRAAQVTRLWKSLADDDALWRGICEQHIGQKCHKCGWGLPILERRRHLTAPASPSPSPGLLPAPSTASTSSQKRKRDELAPVPPSLKRQRSETPAGTGPSTPAPMDTDRSSSSGPSSRRSASPTPNPLLSSSSSSSQQHPSIQRSLTRPWKDVYCERLRIERNWRRGRCTIRTLTGHTDGVMCLQFSETLPHPAFPILITGSYDRTARVWNLETGAEIRCLRGHTRAVRALQFDEAKLVTGSMDRTLKVWDWRTGRCLKTLEGHTEGVVCLNFDRELLASGGVDATVKVWNFRSGECFTLRGHKDWVNAVQLWDTRPSSSSSAAAGSSGLEVFGNGAGGARAQSPNIDPGKMLFSASDDGSIRLWDLTKRACVRQFMGHVGQVQSMRLLLGCQPDPAANPNGPSDASSSSTSSSSSTPNAQDDGETKPPPPPPSSSSGSKPVLISGSLDNTIKLWDIESGKALNTLFGHIEGVWAVAADPMRLVSGSHDRTIKVWERESGRCTATLIGHAGAVTCLAVGEDKIVSGSDDGDVRIWSFAN
ncbi:WD40 repeat-like protein [Punctularia strigosozonata HHB-11173 SS5]|uniref:WD40 repeat-like protein n=1 Tax=Punctularia strigosozonata (strain HHB-11173) TaxID=741275 RepID=UPI0004417C3D|nr:WD40 repeat-like protein [Punctularia strigosozonata HHB-11173 SS5]EIN07571.1 WD40 repeat-like protein [Punctularia strigosozonata HHB-11173 SS5]